MLFLIVYFVIGLILSCLCIVTVELLEKSSNDDKALSISNVEIEIDKKYIDKYMEIRKRYSKRFIKVYSSVMALFLWLPMYLKTFVCFLIKKAKKQ